MKTLQLPAQADRLSPETAIERDILHKLIRAELNGKEIEVNVRGNTRFGTGETRTAILQVSSDWAADGALPVLLTLVSDAPVLLSDAHAIVGTAWVEDHDGKAEIRWEPGRFRANGDPLFVEDFTRLGQEITQS